MDTNTNQFVVNPDVSVLVTVDEVFDNDHRVVNTKGSATGKFTFSAADSGEHKICFLHSAPGGGGWLSGGQMVGALRLNLDLVIGETSQIESTDKSKIQDIVQKVKDLNGRLQDIRREQVFQRVGCHRQERGAAQNSADQGRVSGTRGRIPRSVRIHQCARSQVDLASTCSLGSYLRLAAFAPARLLYQAEIDMKLPAKGFKPFLTPMNGRESGSSIL